MQARLFSIKGVLAIMLTAAALLGLSTYLSSASEAIASQSNPISFSMDNLLSPDEGYDLPVQAGSPLFNPPDQQKAVARPPVDQAEAARAAAQAALSSEAVQQLTDIYRFETWMKEGGKTWAWGEAEPGMVITVTTDAGTWTSWNDENPECPGCFSLGQIGVLLPGDWIEVEATGGVGPYQITVPDPYLARSDTAAGKVVGQVGGWPNQVLEIYPYSWMGEEVREVTTAADGTFSIEIEDMPPDARGYIRWEEHRPEMLVVYHRHFIPVLPLIDINYGHNWLSGAYEPGYEVRIEVSEKGGQIDYWAETTSEPKEYWGDDPGWEAKWYEWQPWQPTFAPGQVVTVTVEDEHVSSLIVGEILGVVNTEADTISGTITAPGLVEPFHAVCAVWEEGGPGFDITVDPADGAYFCDFSSAGWDLLPGMDVGVHYQTPEGHWVFNAFEYPAPQLGVQFWGDNDPAEGGNYSLSVAYINSGSAPADDVILTAVLGDGLSYLADSSGLPVSGSGTSADPLVWQVSQLEPSEYWRSFHLFVEVTASAGESISATVELSTSSIYGGQDPNALDAGWEGQVVENSTQVNVGAWSNTGGPPPGATVLFSVNLCNNSPTGSTEVTLINTLSEELTLLNWYMQHTGWVEVARSEHSLELSRPTLPGGWCSMVWLEAQVDEQAEPGQEIFTQAEIFIDNDLDTEDNLSVNWDNVSSPEDAFVDLGIWPDWINGRFVPRGEIYMSFRLGNDGRLPVEDLVLALDLPPGVSFVSSHRGTPYGPVPAPPDLITADRVEWNIGLFKLGRARGFEVLLRVDKDLPPGSAHQIRASVPCSEGETNCKNNQYTWSIPISGYGSNLYVNTWNWRWDWKNKLEYEVRVKNIGTTLLESPCVEATYPESTTLDDRWFNHGPWVSVEHDPEERTLLYCLERLHPGETASAGYRVNLPDDMVEEEGLTFTNVVSGPVAGDVNPYDNVYITHSYTGPDMFIEGWLSEGTPDPGEEFVVTVRFGNKNFWPWNSSEESGSIIVVRLPEELEFLYATHPYQTGAEWAPLSHIDDMLLWAGQTLWADREWSFDLHLRAAGSVEGGQFLQVPLNVLSGSPNNIDPVPSNNSTVVNLVVEHPKFAISKWTLSPPIAGTDIIYYLDVDNSGNELATQVVIEDPLPAHLTYISGGELSEGVVRWSLAEFPAHTTTTVQFVGRLGCQAGQPVVNQNYRVAASDQGVATSFGQAVAITTAAPSINAQIEASALLIAPNSAITFSGNATTNGAALTYHWDFGDGSEAEDPETNHIYTQKGSYTVKLTAEDACGYKTERSVRVTVLDMLRQVYLPVVRR